MNLLTRKILCVDLSKENLRKFSKTVFQVRKITGESEKDQFLDPQ